MLGFYPQSQLPISTVTAAAPGPPPVVVTVAPTVVDTSLREPVGKAGGYTIPREFLPRRIDRFFGHPTPRTPRPAPWNPPPEKATLLAPQEEEGDEEMLLALLDDLP